MPVKVRGTAIKVLQVLECFGQLPEATSSEIATRTGLSRSIAYGMLETLVEAGYLYRDGPRDRYRLTSRLGQLCQGLNSIQLAATIAAPQLVAITKRIHWPVDFMVRRGLQMVILETSDRLSTLSIARLKRHYASPIFRCAAGFAYAAYCPEVEAVRLRADLSEQTTDPVERNFIRSVFETYLPMVRHGGFSRIDIPDIGERSLAAPIHVFGVPVGVLQLRHILSAPVAWHEIGRLLAEEARKLGSEIEASHQNVTKSLAWADGAEEQVINRIDVPDLAAAPSCRYSTEEHRTSGHAEKTFAPA